MKKFKFLFAMMAVVVVAFFIQSCKDDDDDNYQLDNQTFVNQAANSNNFEIAAGNLAQTKGISAQVRDYGAHMVEEHTVVGNELTALASRKGWTVPAPTALEAEEQSNLGLLNSATGTAFDLEFKRIMTASHEKAVNLFTTASGSSGDGVRDGDLRNFATQKLPALTEHLGEAEALQP